MKTSNRTYLWTLLSLSVLCSVIMTVSCRKTENFASPTNEQSAITSSSNSVGFAYVNQNVDDEDMNAMADEDVASNGCKTITYDSSAGGGFPRTKTVVYNNCQSCKGGTINGTRTVTRYMAGNSAKPGDLLSETDYNNLTVDGVRVTGSVKRYLVSDNPYAVRIVINRTFVVSGNNGFSGTFKADYISTQIGGQGSDDPNDDVFALSGSADGHASLHNGTVASYTIDIDMNNPIITSHDCCWRTRGKETITVDLKVKGQDSTVTTVIDYGDGTCDDLVTVTMDGKSTTTKIPQLSFL